MTVETSPKRMLVTGAAGFVGSHLIDRLLEQDHSVVGIDNFVRGRIGNLGQALSSSRFQFVEMDLLDLSAVSEIAADARVEVVWHMAANSDIAAGAADPNIDLQNTFQTTFNTLAAMRNAGIKQIAFSSSSAVYGVHDQVLREDTGPLFPISNYGAMKLASEALISAAAESFLEHAWIFRFPNVIGPRATHGIIYDLFSKLSSKPTDLEVFGDGTQQKPYLHVSELIDGMLFIFDRAFERLNWFNIGPSDEGVTVAQIAETVLKEASSEIPIRFTGGNKGWIGDVPRFQYSIEKLERLGWRPTLSSLDALKKAVNEIRGEFRTL